MTEQEITDKLKTMLQQDRFEHSMGVRDTAEQLAELYGADPQKARLAGILHDCAKNIPKDKALEMCFEEGIELKDICRFEKGLIHSYLGAHIAEKEFGITDEEILEAIYYHTTGHENMSLLTKIIYLSDMIEPNRKIAGAGLLRIQAFKDLDDALIRAVDSTIRHVINKGGMLDYDTVAARNYLVIQKKKR